MARGRRSPIEVGRLAKVLEGVRSDGHAFHGRIEAIPGLSPAGGADEEARLAIFQWLSEGHARSGTALLTQGKPNERLWFVLEGSVTIERMQSNGRVDVLATLSTPAIFGTTTFFRSTSPSATIRASTDLTLWTLDHEGHQSLRRDDPRASEALALSVVRVLSERFDLLDDRISELMADHGDDHPRANEWANFRARLFEELRFELSRPEPNRP